MRWFPCQRMPTLRGASRVRHKLLSALIVLSVALAACSLRNSPVSPTATGARPATVARPTQAAGTPGPFKPLKVALLISGAHTGSSFWDSARAGVERARKELGSEVRVVEEVDLAKWEPALRRLARGDYDIIVTGGSDMIPLLDKVAPEYIDTKFILFDARADQPNVANIVYAQNEASFLAGALAGCVVTNSELKNLSGEKLIGVVGGMDTEVVNDFVTGYEQGAKYVDQDIIVLKDYAGTWEDPARGKALAAQQARYGANVIFNVAGRTGLGVLEAAKEAERYSIGVDSNQNGRHPGSVLSSVMKRVDYSIFDLIQREATDTLQTGRTYPYSIQNDGVGLAEDALYEQYVPEQCRQQVEKAKQDIASKKVIVQTAYK